MERQNMTGFFSTHTPHPAKNLCGSQSINFYIVKIRIFGSKFWSAPLSTGPRPREESGADHLLPLTEFHILQPP